MAKIAGREISPEEAELLAALEEAGGKPRKNGIFQQVLDPDWYKKYNELTTDYGNAAMKNAAENGGEYVTYYRVQTPGNDGSFERIQVNEDGTISIGTSKSNLSISAYTLDHAEYYASTGKRAGKSYIISFIVPKWFDDIVRETAVIQDNFSRNPLNRGKTAPKMVDPTTAGYAYELPPFWNKWLETVATNAQRFEIGGS